MQKIPRKVLVESRYSRIDKNLWKTAFKKFGVVMSFFNAVFHTFHLVHCLIPLPIWYMWYGVFPNFLGQLSLFVTMQYLTVVLKRMDMFEDLKHSKVLC